MQRCDTLPKIPESSEPQQSVRFHCDSVCHTLALRKLGRQGLQDGMGPRDSHIQCEGAPWLSLRTHECRPPADPHGRFITQKASSSTSYTSANVASPVNLPATTQHQPPGAPFHICQLPPGASTTVPVRGDSFRLPQWHTSLRALKDLAYAAVACTYLGASLTT